MPNLLDPAGQYNAGQRIGLAKQEGDRRDFMLAMDADAVERQKQKEKDIKEAIAELQKSGVPYSQAESAAMAVAMAGGNEKEALDIHHSAMLRIQGKPGEPFTLGQGQVRFGPGGEEIARGPERVAGSPAWRIVDDPDSPTGKVWQDLNTGSPGPPAPKDSDGFRPYFQHVGTTSDGKAVVFDARTKKFSTEPLPGGELPGVKSKKALPANEAETLGALATTLEDIDLVREAWETGLTGAFQGRTNEALQYVRNHPAFEALRRRVGRLITIAYGLSGKQISEREMKMLEKNILPSVQQMDQNFLKALDELDDWVKRNIRNKQNAYRGANYEFEPFNVDNVSTPKKKGAISAPTQSPKPVKKLDPTPDGRERWQFDDGSIRIKKR